MGIDRAAVVRGAVLHERGIVDQQGSLIDIDRAPLQRAVQIERAVGDFDTHPVNRDAAALSGIAALAADRLILVELAAVERGALDASAFDVAGGGEDHPVDAAAEVAERHSVDRHVRGFGEVEDADLIAVEGDMPVPFDHHAFVERREGVRTDRLVDIDHAEIGFERHRLAVVRVGNRFRFDRAVVDTQRLAQRDQPVPLIDDVDIGRHVHRRGFGTFAPFVRAVVVNGVVRTGVPRQVDRRIAGRFGHAGAVDRRGMLVERILRRNIVAAGEELLACLLLVVVGIGRHVDAFGIRVERRSIRDVRIRGIRTPHDRAGDRCCAGAVGIKVIVGVSGGGRPADIRGRAVGKIDPRRRVVGDQRLIDRQTSAVGIKPRRGAGAVLRDSAVIDRGGCAGRVNRAADTRGAISDQGRIVNRERPAGRVDRAAVSLGGVPGKGRFGYSNQPAF